MSTQMPTIVLTRYEQNDHGTFGMMTLPQPWTTLHTCEDDWLNNRRGVSCIPAGTYMMHRTWYHKRKIETFEIIVPHRSRILVHPGNTEEDSEGCVLVGMRRGKIMVEKDEDTLQPKVLKEAVVDSRNAFYNHFMSAMAKYDQGVINVQWGPGLPLVVAV